MVGILCDAASAAFLRLLELATAFRTANPDLVWTLPIAGLLLGAVYEG